MVSTSPSARMTMPLPTRSVPSTSAVKPSSGISARSRTTERSTRSKSKWSELALGCSSSGNVQSVLSLMRARLPARRGDVLIAQIEQPLLFFVGHGQQCRLELRARFGATLDRRPRANRGEPAFYIWKIVEVLFLPVVPGDPRPRRDIGDGIFT